MTIIMGLLFTSYTTARIEINNAHQMNDITIVNSQPSSEEYRMDGMSSVQPPKKQPNSLYQRLEQNVRGTSRPETVLPRPYNDQRRLRPTEYQNQGRNVLSYNQNDNSVQLHDNEKYKHYNHPDEYVSRKEIVPQDDDMVQYDARTSANQEFAPHDEIAPKYLHNHNLILVHSRDGYNLSLQENRPSLGEHQAQRPPTGVAYPLINSHSKNISYEYKYGVPEPTFESVSSPDLQIEKIDGSYIGASDATTIQH